MGKREGVFEVFDKEQIKLQKGDSIRFTRSISSDKIVNSQLALVSNISKKDIELSFIGDDGAEETRVLPFSSNALRHIDYNYCSTAHRAQGSDRKYVIAMAESWRRNLSNQKNFYVEISRAKEKAFLYVDDKASLIEQLEKNTGERLAALTADPKNNNLDEPKETKTSEKSQYFKIEISENDLKRGFEEYAINEFGSVSDLNVAVSEAFNNPNTKIRFGNKKNLEMCWRGEAGYIKDYKTGFYSSFGKGNMIKDKSAAIKSISREEIEKQRAASEKQRVAQLAELKARYEKVSQKVTSWLKNEKPLVSSKYLDKKGLSGIKIEGLKYSKKFGILIPLKDINGKITSMQRIGDDGAKRMQKDGKMQGSFFIVGENKLQNSKRVFLAEGLATAVSIYKATGNPVVMAVSADNLKKVAPIFKDKYKDKELIVAADNDSLKKSGNHYINKDNNSKKPEDLNKGLSVAKEIKFKHGIDYIYPQFDNKTHSSKLNDFNDLAQHKGEQEVQRQISTQYREIEASVSHSNVKEIERDR